MKVDMPLNKNKTKPKLKHLAEPIFKSQKAETLQYLVVSNFCHPCLVSLTIVHVLVAYIYIYIYIYTRVVQKIISLTQKEEPWLNIFGFGNILPFLIKLEKNNSDFRLSFCEGEWRWGPYKGQRYAAKLKSGRGLELFERSSHK